MRHTLRRLLLLLFIVSSPAALSACNTVGGFGEDVEEAGDYVEETADDVEDEIDD